MARVVARWFPESERGRAQGLVYTFALAGGAFAPVACDWLIGLCGWRGAFVAFGGLGLVWVIPFYAWFRDHPREQPAVNAGELRLLESERMPHGDVHGAIPWGVVWSSPTVWLLGFVITCTSFNAYFYFTWYPSYLEKGRGLPADVASRMASIVLAAAAVGSLSGGCLLDRVVHLTGNRRWSRCAIGSTGLALAGMLSWVSTRIDHPTSAVACTALAAFMAMGTMASWWNAVTEVSGPHVGALFGLLNSMGGVGGAGSPIFMGWFVDRLAREGLSGRAQWDPPFVVVAAVLLGGACVWLFIDSSQAVTQHTESHPAE
jgi:sugar phosphate permease